MVHKWSSYLEIFSLPQVIENFRQYLLPISEQIFYRKQSLDALDQNCEKQTTIGLIAAHFLVHFLAVDLHDCNVKRPENSSWFLFRREIL